MLPVPNFSSPQLDHKRRGYTDLLHPICDVRFSGRNGDATTGRRGAFHPRHAVHGTDVAFPHLTG